MPSSTALRISGREGFRVERAVAPMPSLAKRAISSVSDGCVRAESEHEIQDVEELGRGPLRLGVSGLMKSTGGAAAGAGLPRNCDSGWTL